MFRTNLTLWNSPSCDSTFWEKNSSFVCCFSCGSSLYEPGLGRGFFIFVVEYTIYHKTSYSFVRMQLICKLRGSCCPTSFLWQKPGLGVWSQEVFHPFSNTFLKAVKSIYCTIYLGFYSKYFQSIQIIVIIMYMKM